MSLVCDPACAECKAPTSLADRVLILRSLRTEGTQYAWDLANALATAWQIDWAVAEARLE